MPRAKDEQHTREDQAQREASEEMTDLPEVAPRAPENRCGRGDIESDSAMRGAWNRAGE
jgi:hypothetical protein